MTNRTKIIIIAIIVAILVIGIIAAININKKNAEETTNKSGLSEFDQYMDQMNNSEENEISENNELEENTIENNTVIDEETPNETQNNNSNNNQSTVIGKEEQESDKGNNEESNRQKAIKLAQEEWGISISSYDFQADLKSDGTYEVTVRSNDVNRTTVAIYKVNVETGTVTE